MRTLVRLTRRAAYLLRELLLILRVSVCNAVPGPQLDGCQALFTQQQGPRSPTALPQRNEGDRNLSVVFIELLEIAGMSTPFVRGRAGNADTPVVLSGWRQGTRTQTVCTKPKFTYTTPYASV